VNLEVTPMGATEGRHFLVLFEDAAARRQESGRARAGGKPARGKKPRGSEQLVSQLEDELAATREHLQAIIHDLAAANEELQSANEEILSSNEELQSTNEELDTAKEELQSTNEELSTLNDELEGRNDEMSQVNSDLLNLLASVNIPIVIVTSDLKIRRFTPAAEKTLNLIPSDVGRPIGHIKPNIVCPDLEALITEVVESVTPREREVEDQDGHVFSLRIRPYKNVENKIDGAILTLVDVSTGRDSAAELQLARATTEALLAAVSTPILVLSSDLKVRRANQAFYDRFKTSAGQTEGRVVYELDGGRWQNDGWRQMLEQALPGQASVDGFVINQPADGSGARTLTVDGRRIAPGSRTPGIILLAIRDVRDDVS
jgi:two-component system CheB/CheR fusion protein